MGDDSGAVKFPKKLKEAYAIAGKIRAIHLHLQRISEFLPEKENKPVEHLYLLSRN